MMSKLKTVLGVSAGNGILLYPFLKHGLDLKGNIEIRPDYTIQRKPLQFHLNFPGVPFLEDLTNFSLPTVDIIIGHPKCGNSSKLALSRGKEYRSDKHRTDKSFNLFIEAVSSLKPKVFLLENLPKLLDEISLKEIQERTNANYIQAIHINDLELGGSQETRNRIIIIGSQQPLVYPIIKVNRTQTAQQLIYSISASQTGHFREPLHKSIAIYGGKKLTIFEIRDYWFKYKPDRKFLVIDPEQRKRMHHAPGVYINWEGMLPKTVRKSNRQFSHKGLPMTPRELARLQNIPDDFELLNPEDFNISYTTALNKDRITVGSTPSYNVGLWFLEILKLNNLL